MSMSTSSVPSFLLLSIPKKHPPLHTRHRCCRRSGRWCVVPCGCVAHWGRWSHAHTRHSCMAWTPGAPPGDASGGWSGWSPCHTSGGEIVVSSLLLLSSSSQSSLSSYHHHHQGMDSCCTAWWRFRWLIWVKPLPHVWGRDCSIIIITFIIIITIIIIIIPSSSSGYGLLVHRLVTLQVADLGEALATRLGERL